MKALVPLLLLASSCAYFNGIYNAREAARRGEKQQRAGKDGEAASSYATAAVKAETVLARYPKSRWSTEALYVAGIGEAMSEQCILAVDRLQRFLERDASQEKRARATVALASCHVRTGKYSQALSLLDPVLQSRNRLIAERATLWAARAAIGMGDNDRANTLLSRVDASATQWELAAASLQRGDLVRAESLFALRADRGDYREEVIPSLTSLWADGRREQVLDIVRRYQASRLRSSSKARLNLAMADLLTAAEVDSTAREFLLNTKRLSTDTLLDKEASARLTLLSLRDRADLVTVANAINASATSARKTAIQRRLEDNLTLIAMLHSRGEPTGAALFLAGEVARDSLRARQLAGSLFLRAASPHLDGVVAPKALLAAASLMPDSAEQFHEQLRQRFPRSPYVVMLDGGDPGTSPILVETDRLLRAWWDTASRFLADTTRERLNPSQLTAPTLPPSASTSTSQWLVHLTPLR